MARKKKTLLELKDEQKKLSDLIKQKEKEAESKALVKMGIEYIIYLIENEETLNMKNRISQAGLTEDELNIIREKYSKEKKKIQNKKNTE